MKEKKTPDVYTVCNTDTIDSEMDLLCLDGVFPEDISGSLFICQCLGSPKAFMIGDTNIVRLDFNSKGIKLTNRLIWNPAGISRIKLADTKHRFRFFGLMFLSPGLGLHSYTEGMYLMPDDRIAVTSDVDRPWLIEQNSLKAVTPLGKRDEWLPMMEGQAGEAMGNLFAGYNNFHVIYNDVKTDEVFLANFQYKQKNSENHPVILKRHTGNEKFDSYLVLNKEGGRD